MKHTPGKKFVSSKAPPPKPGTAEYRFREALVKDGILKSVDSDIVRKDRPLSAKSPFIKKNIVQLPEDKPWPTWKLRTLKYISWLIFLGIWAFLVYTFIYNIQI